MQRTLHLLVIWGSKKGQMIWIPHFISKSHLAVCCFSDSRCSNSPLPRKGFLCDLEWYHVGSTLAIVHPFLLP